MKSFSSLVKAALSRRYMAFMTIFIIGFLWGRMGNAQTSPSNYLIPAPYSEQDHEGQFTFPEEITYSLEGYDKDSLDPVLSQMRHFYKKHLDKSFKKSVTDATINIRYSDTISNAEGYVLKVGEDDILLEGKDSRGIFYGWQTLQQIILYTTINGYSTLPCTEIYDYPRFSFRAMMLDPARHFLSVDDIKSFIRTMAFYKYDYLHLHLTDDQGWRIQIKAYPELTEKGAMVKQKDGSYKPEFYTQEELKELVSYAKDYHIEIIPEIDFPGHNIALLTVFPELACFPKGFNSVPLPACQKIY